MLGEEGNNTDEESNRRSYGIDEFGDIHNKHSYVRTGKIQYILSYITISIIITIYNNMIRSSKKEVCCT